MIIPATLIIEYDNDRADRVRCEIDTEQHIVLSYGEVIEKGWEEDAASTGANYILDDNGNQYLVMDIIDLEELIAELEADGEGCSVEESLERDGWLEGRVGYIAVDYGELCYII